MSRRRAGAIAALLLAACGRPAPRPDAGTPPSASAIDVASATRAADAIAAASARTGDVGWRRLGELAGRYGRRINGSTALDGALAWSVRQMRADGLERVRLERVAVPHWVRGAEHGRIVRPVRRPLALTALGGSVGTGGRLHAPVVGFDSLEALRASTARLDGTIAFVNHRMHPFDEAHDDPGYRNGMQARLHAASEAAKRGARAVLVRSVTAVRSPLPHTGALAYEGDVPRIPAAAVSTEDADRLAALLHDGPVEAEVALGARMLPDAPSANAIGELRGRELPDEVVLLGAHLDSWDVGPGAADDGAGCVAIMEALRLLREAHLVPRRTLRIVLFTSEEYLVVGGADYGARHGDERHVAAFETDYGMGAPDAIGAGSEDGVQAMAPLLPLFERFGIRRFRPHAFGADVQPIVATGAPPFDLEPDGRHYFDVHHSAADTIDAIRPEDLRGNAGAIALLAWVLAER